MRRLVKRASEVIPQLRFIHAHQLFRTQYTFCQSDTVNMHWWIRMNVCRVVMQRGRRGGPQMPPKRGYSQSRGERIRARTHENDISLESFLGSSSENVQ